MSICQTCKNIPWHKLPVTRKEAVPHQPTLAALEKSATECPLCRLIWLEYQQALRKPSVSYDQRYIDGLLRDRELPRTQIRVYGREDQIGLIHFKVHEIGFEIAVGTHDGEALAEKFARRPVHIDPASESSLRHAIRWVENFNANHVRCAPPAGSKASRSGTPLPSRVLDVGEKEKHVKLFEANGRCARYISLSYCWGTSTPCTTTLKSLPARQQGIDIETLPKTLLDAVLVIRWMGIRYLWIDALCIVQDNLRDWERESSQMATIYANSYLTIAASNSADVALGFLTDRTRPDVMFFECQQRMMAEDGESAGPSSTHELFHDTGAWHQTEDVERNYEEWAPILTDYSERKLSRRSDRFAALSGLAGVIARRFWRQVLRRYMVENSTAMLLWEINPRVQKHDLVDPRTSIESDEWYAPTWSPLSVDTTIQYSLIPVYPHWDDLQLAVFLDYHVNITDEDPFSSIRNARIQVRAALLPLTPTVIPTVPAALTDNRSPVEICIGNGNMGGCAYPDSRTPPPHSAFALFLKKPSKGYHDGRMGDYNWHGLVVERSGKDSDEFRRLGLLYAKPASYSGDGDVDDILLAEPPGEFFLV